MAETSPGATAAPAAGEAVGGGKPSGQPGGGQEKGPEQKGAAAAPGAPEGKQIKPIPPSRPRINDLGFQPNTKEVRDKEGRDPDGFPDVRAHKKAAPEGKPEGEAGGKPGEQPGRDPVTGRFTKPPEPGPDGKPAAPSETKPGAEGEGTKPQAAPPAPGQAKTLEEANQTNRSLHGMFKDLNARIQRTTEERDGGYKTAHAWKDVAERALKELETLKSGGGRAEVSSGAAAGQPAAGGGESPASLPSVDEVLGQLDMEAFDQIARVGGLTHAGKFLASEILEVVLGKVVPALQARQDEALKPILTSRASEQMSEHVEQVVNQVAGLRTLDGNPAFPELLDVNVQEEVGRAWVQAGLPPELAMTPQGTMAAVALYRMVKGLPGAPSATETASLLEAASAAAGGQPARPASAIAASVSAEPAGNAPPNQGRSQHSPATQRLINALSKTELVDRNLGFARNKSAPALQARR